MATPVNAAAKEVERLRRLNLDLDEQIRVLRDTQLANSEVIGNLSHIAVWEEAEGDEQIEEVAE